MDKKKMILIGTAYPYRGGIAAFNERLARQFQEEGCEVIVYTFTLQYPGFLFPGKTQCSTAQAPVGLSLRRCINSINPLNWVKVGKEINRQRFDMVLFAYWMSFFAPCYGTIARQLKNTKRIALVHNMIPHEQTILDKCFPPYFIKSMDGFVALSESVMKDIDRLDKMDKPKAWSPHPIYDSYGAKESRETALLNLNLDGQYHYLLFFGLVRAYKGLDWLLEAFADERLRKASTKLIVAGEFYEGKEAYLSQIKKLGLEDKVLVYDEFIPDEKVKDYFNAADIVVQPYKSATQSGVTQIAYHFEKPMLVTDVGGLSEIVPNGVVGYVTQPNPSAIADALVDFYKNARAEGFEKNIAVEKKKYSWERMVKTILSVAK